MPRVTRPSDMQTRRLDGARNPATINPNVAAKIGQAGAAWNRALTSVGNAFAQVATAAGQASDANNYSDAKLAFLKADNEHWTTLNKEADEQGSGLERTGSMYEKTIKDISERYPISDARKRAALTDWMTNRAAQRGFDAARLKQTRLRTYHKGQEDRAITGATSNLATNPSLENLQTYRETVIEKIKAGEGIYWTKADVQRRIREFEGKLATAYIKAHSEKDPNAIKELFGKIAATGLFKRDDKSASGGVVNLPSSYQSVKNLSKVIHIRRGFIGPMNQSTPQLRERLGTMVANMPKELRESIAVGSAYRGLEEQAELRAKYEAGVGGLAAKPGRSRHNFGEAVDIMPRGGWKAKTPEYRAALRWMQDNAPKYGLQNPERIRARDPVHFQVIRNWKGKLQPSGGSSGGLAVNLTAYAPKRGGDRMQGGYESSIAGPDGKNTVRTLDDYANGRSQYITIAGNPKYYGRTYTIPRITYIDSDGKSRVLTNVKAVVHDTGKAFETAPEGRFDIPVARDVGQKTRNDNRGAWSRDGVQFIPDGEDAQASIQSELTDPRNPTGMEGMQLTGEDQSDPVARLADFGLLKEGQRFSVIGEDGSEIALTSEQWNALTPQQVRNFQRFADERSVTQKREREAIAKGMIRDNRSHRSAYGTDHPDYDPDFIAQTFKHNPDYLKRVEAEQEAKRRYHSITEGSASLPSDILKKRLAEMKPKQGEPNFYEHDLEHRRALKAQTRLLNARDKDPALAVDGGHQREKWGEHKLVGAVRSKFPNGHPQNAKDWSMLIGARVNAQEALGIAQMPLTRREASAWAGKLKQIGDDPEQRLRNFYAELVKNYGETWAEEVGDQAINQAVKNEDKRKLLKQLLDDFEKEGPAGPQYDRTKAELDRQEKQIDGTDRPPEPNQAPGQTGSGQMGNQSQGPVEPIRSSGQPRGKRTPNNAAIQYLKDNPSTENQLYFEKHYNLKPGAAAKFLEQWQRDIEIGRETPD